MAQIVQQSELGLLSGPMQHWAYNALDCCVTHEVYGVLRERLNSVVEATYRFEMASQAPAMAMMRRGVAVDHGAIKRALNELDTLLKASHARVNELLPPGAWDRRAKVTGWCRDGKRHAWPRDEPDETRKCGRCGQARMVPAPLNPNSDDQVMELLYERLGLPAQHHHKTHRPTVDEDALDRLRRRFPEHMPLIDAVLEARGAQKAKGFVASPLSPDGRMHSSFNVGAPETGRWSSSADHYGYGTNLQNIPEKLRYIFVADPGMELFYADLEQAESCCVAYLAQDEGYIEAHKAGDVHTYVARLIWPGLPWTGDLARDREVAERLRPDWDRDHSYRYNAKRIQHGSNYGLTAHGLAQLAHIPVKAADEAQGAYFGAFPGIPQWQKDTVRELTETHTLTTPLGRRRLFFGRHWDKHVQRQAIAQIPQSMVADILNLALWRIWNELDTCVSRQAPRVTNPNRCWLLAQVHDAVLGEVRKGDDATIRRVLDLMSIPVVVHGRTMCIGVDVKRGQNWGKAGPANPGGMR